MRTATFEALSTAETDDVLTTGEAAALLNSSRQHVVDLCERGELAFTTVRTHRRVRRADVEAIRTGTQRLTRDQRRSLWLSYAVAGRIVADPAVGVATGRRGLAKMRSTERGQATRWLDEWEKLLDGPLPDLLDALTSRSPKSRELRQNSPFAGLLTSNERKQALATWHTAERDGHA